MNNIFKKIYNVNNINSLAKYLELKETLDQLTHDGEYVGNTYHDLDLVMEKLIKRKNA